MEKFILVAVLEKPIDPELLRKIGALDPQYLVSTPVEIGLEGKSHYCASIETFDSVMPSHLNGRPYRAKGGNWVLAIAGFISGLLSNPNLKPREQRNEV